MSLAFALAVIAWGPAAASPHPCRPVAGAQALWARPEVRYILVGEMHGTRETPALFADLACDAGTSGRRVVVALERPEAEQRAIDAFMASNGDASAVTRFLASPMWRGPWADGRSSLAYLAMFKRLREMRASGEVAAVVGLEPATWTAPATQSSSNADMADRVKAAAGHRPGSVVLVLVGDLHASKAVIDAYGDAFTPMAADLPANETVALDVRADGMAWNCHGPKPSDCGPHDTADESPVRRQVVLDAKLKAGYDGIIDLGVHTTASPPAVASAR